MSLFFTETLQQGSLIYREPVTPPAKKYKNLSYPNVQYLLKITGHFLARVIDCLVFFVKCKTVKCNFRGFLSKKY